MKPKIKLKLNTFDKLLSKKYSILIVLNKITLIVNIAPVPHSEFFSICFKSLYCSFKTASDISIRGS